MPRLFALTVAALLAAPHPSFAQDMNDMHQMHQQMQRKMQEMHDQSGMSEADKEFSQSMMSMHQAMMGIKATETRT